MGFKVGPDVEDWDGVNPLTKNGVGSFVDFLKSQYGMDPIITSGRRSVENNAQVGGAENSYHLTGDAADLYIGDISDELAENIRAQAAQNGWGEVLYHDAGSGRHLHLANLNGQTEAPATVQYPMDIDMDMQDFLLPEMFTDTQSSQNIDGDFTQSVAAKPEVDAPQQEFNMGDLYKQIEQVASYDTQPQLSQQYESTGSMLAKGTQPKIDPRMYAEYFARLKRKYLV